MLYRIKLPNYRGSAQLETEDEKIVQATPAFRWSIGMRIAVFERLSQTKGYTVEIMKDQTKRSPSLGTVHEDPKPSDAELARRVSS